MPLAAASGAGGDEAASRAARFAALTHPKLGEHSGSPAELPLGFVSKPRVTFGHPATTGKLHERLASLRRGA